MDPQEFIEEGADKYLSNLSIDLVVIGYQGGELKCLLLKIGERWLLPGGYVGKEESVEEAVARNLQERAGLENPHMRFLSVFGGKDRQFKEEFKAALEKRGMAWKEEYWINDRFVTLAYYSLVNIAYTHPEPGFFDDAFDWFSFDELPEMWMDHKEIVHTARQKLKEDTRLQPLTYRLLPEEFTMPELHQLHQTILQENLDRSRFQKKMLASGIFERLPKRQKISPGRNPYQYRVNP
ncbi:MAG: NUDIX domain-containing protein [Bacteroidota bacterium]